MNQKTQNDNTFLLGGCKLRLKGNCHCHTDYSDAVFSAEQAVQAYRQSGYDFLFITDHCDKLVNGKLVDCASLDSPAFRVLPGVEYRCAPSNPSKQVHILGLATEDLSFWEPGQALQETIDGINKDSGLAIIAHPHWNGLTSAELAGLRGVCAVEVFNSTCQSTNSKGCAITLWEELLALGMRTFAIAVDDTHYGDRFLRDHSYVADRRDFALAWTVVDTETRTHNDIVQAIRMGRFYSSCGPQIHEWKLTGAEMTFRCSPVKTITVSSFGPRGRVFRDYNSGTLCSASVNLENLQAAGKWPFIRFSCCDAKGRWAWTNPLFQA